MNILYEDNHLILVNKAPGILTQPNETSSDDLESSLKILIKQRDSKPGNVFLGTVHRLDKPVSGIVVFAKTSKALSRLNEVMRNKKCKKKYLAITEGHPPEPLGTLEHYLLHDSFKATIVSKNTPQAKLALLHYQVIDTHSSKSFLAIELTTGRYHQIRCQLSAIGCPIIGDKKYGSRFPYNDMGIALHHEHLELEHPTTKKMLSYHCPIPASFQKTAEEFRLGWKVSS